MIDKIIETIKGYGLRNNADVLSQEQKAEMEAQITYLEKMKDFSYVREIETLKDRIEMLQGALLEATVPTPSTDKRVSRVDFIEMWDTCCKKMWEEQEKDIEGPYTKKIYGTDVYVHWNGLYCDCYDGATVANNIIPAIKAVDEDVEGDEPK